MNQARIGRIPPSSAPASLSRATRYAQRVMAVEWVERTESTNAELVRRERVTAQPHLHALATLDQTQGRGRLGRTWTAPPGSAVALSVVIRPGSIPPDRLGLLTLLAGLAARDAVASLLPTSTVSVKWPNDVLIGGRKVAGVLAEVEPSTGAVILGVGVNTAMTTAQLPVPTATSIAIESGAESTAPTDPRALAEPVVTAFLARLTGLVERFEAAGGDLDSARIREELEAACGTLGERVAVEQPDGVTTTGLALGIGPDGALIVRKDGSDGSTAILAGDVTHLRYQ